MIDIDNFKTINDSYGHINGNDLIKKADESLYQAKRKGKNRVGF